MGVNRGIVRFGIHMDKSQTPFKTNGVEIFFTNGRSIFLGRERSGVDHPADLPLQVTSIKVEPLARIKEGQYRSFVFYHEEVEMDYHWLFNPLVSST